MFQKHQSIMARFCLFIFLQYLTKVLRSGLLWIILCFFYAFKLKHNWKHVSWKKKVLNSYDFDAIFDNETTSSDYFVRSSLCIYIQVILHFLYIVRGNHTFVSHSLFQLRPVCSNKNHFSLFCFFFIFFTILYLIVCFTSEPLS